jgi:hypothetical protein
MAMSKALAATTGETMKLLQRERDKELLTQGQKKKLLEVREIRNYS